MTLASAAPGPAAPGTSGNRPLPPIPPGVLREVVIETGAIRDNVAALRARVATPHLLVVVKADGYGHGAAAAARAALAGGADWLGVADLGEALALRRAGVDAPILAWLHAPTEDFVDAVDAGVDVAVSTPAQMEAVCQAARTVQSARGGKASAAVQLALDTGLHRNGAPPATWGALFALARRAEEQGLAAVRGLLSHVSNTSPAEDRAQLAAFQAGVEQARAAGLRPELLHIAATAAALSLPETRLAMARLGIGAYGLSPFDGDPRGLIEGLPLRPAMTLRAPVAAVRPAEAGSGVSYGFTYRTTQRTSLALIPLGYADGIPRAASGRGVVTIGGRRFRQVGRVAMDQFVVDLAGVDSGVRVGDEAVVFGDPARGAASADEWAAAAGTIGYEIVTRLGPRVTRTVIEATR